MVGRTGSGKSSLLMALTGLVPRPLRQGEIFVDGEEISTRPLLQHRASVAVIPQAMPFTTVTSVTTADHG